MNWYLEVFKKYAVFDGRARRKEYWFFMLFHLIAVFALTFVDGMLGLFSAEAGIGLLSTVYLLGAFIPGLAVSVRRLHDTGRTGWWLLIALVPLIGLVFLIFMLLDSNAEENKYGPNPKLAAA